MQLPALDIPTLCVVSALVIAFSGAVLIATRGRDTSADALVYWGAAMLAGSLGIVLLSLEPFTTLPARAGADVAILLGVGLGWTGARRFGGRSVRPVVLVGGAALWLAAYLRFGSVFPVAVDVLAYLLGGFYALMSAAELWRDRHEPLRSRGSAVVLLLMHGGVYLVQAAGSTFDPGFFLSARTGVVLLVEGMLHTVGMAFLLLALMKERAELHSRTQLLELATRDALTGLANRRLFDQAIRREFRVAARVGAPLSLLMVDVDHFKLFNDTYGHQAGDGCLQMVATAIDDAAHRSGDLAARYGGEEFALLLPATEADGATLIAEAVRTGVASLGIPHRRVAGGLVTVSVGVASVVPGNGPARIELLISAADDALYAAKRAGRNRVATQPAT